MTGARGTAYGFLAIALWSLLALLTAASGPVPPLQLAAMTFLIGGSVGLLAALARGRLALVRPTPLFFLLGLFGPVGDTMLYFAALKLAPAAEANLIHYLWPLLIVVFAAFLPGHELRPRHVVAALLGLAATLLIVGREFGAGAGVDAWIGYALALLGALVWASYSVISRRFAGVPSEALSASLLVGAGLALAGHAAFETTVWPATVVPVLAILGLGLGPIGMAYFLWDFGMKEGDVSLLGVASYAAPVLSTVTLVAAGFAEARWPLLVACLLVVAGGLIASTERPRSSRPMRVPIGGDES